MKVTSTMTVSMQASARGKFQKENLTLWILEARNALVPRVAAGSAVASSHVLISRPTALASRNPRMAVSSVSASAVSMETGSMKQATRSRCTHVRCVTVPMTAGDLCVLLSLTATPGV